MKRHRSIATVLIVLMVSSAARGGPVVDITADVDAAGLVGAFQAGDIVPITFSISSNSRAPLFGVDFELAAATDDVRIVSVAFNPAFSTGLERAPIELPASRVRGIRVQPPGAIDRTLGTNGESIPFATIEVEILNGGSFESGLEVSATGALVGRIPDATTVLGMSPGHRGHGRRRGGRATGTIAIVNVQPEIQEVPWGLETADLILEVHPLGGGEPVTTLAANTTYELHYDVATTEVSGYVLYAIADSAGQSLASATPPPVGEWADTGLFTYIDNAAELSRSNSAPGFAEGFYKHDVVGDDIWPCGQPCAAPQGHLCNFTTEEAGELILQLIMYHDDLEARMTVAMEAEVALTVL